MYEAEQYCTLNFGHLLPLSLVQVSARTVRCDVKDGVFCFPTF